MSALARVRGSSDRAGPSLLEPRHSRDQATLDALISRYRARRAARRKGREKSGSFYFVIGGCLASLRVLSSQFQLQPGCFPQLNSVEICVQLALPQQPEEAACQ